VHHGSVGGEVPTATPGLLPVRAGEDRRRIGGGAQGEGAPTQDERVAELGTELPEAHGRRVAPGSEIIRVLDQLHHQSPASDCSSAPLHRLCRCIRSGVEPAPPDEFSMSVVLSKAEARETVWRAMEMRGVARFPGCKGRIPNFAGAERAALRLRDLPAWRDARVVKINPDASQLPVRRMAL